MIRAQILAIVIAVSVSPLISAQSPKKRVTSDDPEKSIALAIKLLEAKDHVAFIREFMPPAALAKALEKRDIHEVAKEDVGDRGEKWIREFNLVRGTKPVFHDEQTKATFRAKSADGKSVEVKLTLIDGKWYLK